MRRNFDTRAWYAHRERLQDAIDIAVEFLSRWDDSVTQSSRDDIGLRAALLAVQGFDTLRDRRRFPAFVRTIARRQRAEAVRRHLRRQAGYDTEFEFDDEELAQEPPDEQHYFVNGAWVSHADLMRFLPGVLAQLSQLNEQILLGYYEGFSCDELASRFAITVENVKVRIHRARSRVKELLEERARIETAELRRGTVPRPRQHQQRAG